MFDYLEEKNKIEHSINDFVSDKLVVRQDSAGYRGVFASRAIKQGELLLAA